jgi:hypothetical protein
LNHAVKVWLVTTTGIMIDLEGRKKGRKEKRIKIREPLAQLLFFIPIALFLLPSSNALKRCF